MFFSQGPSKKDRLKYAMPIDGDIYPLELFWSRKKSYRLGRRLKCIGCRLFWTLLKFECDFELLGPHRGHAHQTLA